MVTALVFFSFESQGGTNTWTQYLAVFVRPQEVPDDPPVRFSLLGVLPIGGTSFRSLEEKRAQVTADGGWLAEPPARRR